MIRCSLLAFGLITSFSVFSQKIQLIRSGEVIDSGIAAYDSGNYEQAIKTYLSINPRDTNYVMMLAELALAYNGAKQYEKTIEVCNEALKDPASHKAMLLKSKAIALDKMGKYDESVQLFEEAMVRYPTDQNLVFNLGVTHFNNKAIEKAKDCFFRSLSINPYHAGSHLNLGMISVNEGRKVHAMLSYGLYIAINDKDNARLVMLNNLLANELQDEGSTPPDGPNAFEKLDQIIRAKIAMDKNFKSKIPVEAAVVRQFEMFFEQVDLYDGSVQDPWVDFYLPIFRAIKEKKAVEPFIYHLISSANNDKVKSWHKKNEKVLKGFYEMANTEIKSLRTKPKLPQACGFEKNVSGWYNDDSKLTALGSKTSDGKNTGPWVYFFVNGERSAEGVFGKDGKKTGLWRYYNSSGVLTSEENLSTGEIIAYYGSGEKNQHYFLKDDKVHGDVEIWFQCGALKEKLTYKHGSIHGKGELYYPNGQKSSVYNYDEGQLSGDYATYYGDGKLKSKYTNKDNQTDGPFVEYHANGNIAMSGKYLKDELEGEWKYFHANGRLSRTGTYQKSLGHGEWLYYNMRGELIEKRNLDNGKLHGENTFYQNGKLYYTYTYDKDKLTRVVYYDRDGKAIGDFGNSEGDFEAKAFYMHGEIKSEGRIVRGELNGEWKYYYRHGKPSSKYQYESGLVQGEAEEYYPSGAIKVKSNYLDNELHGYYQEFYEHGPLKTEGWYVHGKRQQTFLAYTADGKLESDYYYLNDEPTGATYDYHDGKLLSSLVYKNGLIEDLRNYNRSGKNTIQVGIEGPKKIFETRFDKKPVLARFEILCGEYTGSVARWFPDGKEFYSYQLLGNRRHGPYKYYGLDNNLEAEGQYVNGQLEGIWKGYFENGKPDHIGRFVDDNYDSLWTYYYPNGQISSTVEYFQNERDGLTKIFAPDGSPAVEKVFEAGDLISYRTMTQNATWSDWQQSNGDASLVAYYPNGNKSVVETYKNNHLTGVKRINYPDGKAYSEFNFLNGDNHGTFTLYYTNGKVRKQGEHRYDDYEGIVKFYNEDGSLRRTEEYVNGRRTGKVIYYNKGLKARESNFWGGLPDE